MYNVHLVICFYSFFSRGATCIVKIPMYLYRPYNVRRTLYGIHCLMILLLLLLPGIRTKTLPHIYFVVSSGQLMELRICVFVTHCA